MEAKTNPIIDEMIAGYGPDFPSLEELFSMVPSEEKRRSMSSPISLLGRYGKSVEFMKDITSGEAVSLYRFKVIKKYLIALSEFLEEQDLPEDEKIIGRLSSEDIAAINKIGTTIDEVYQAEKIERFTEHDTAAAGDFIKLRIATELPHLAKDLEAVCFAETSEDTMSITFGLIANELVFGHFFHSLAQFCLEAMYFIDRHEENGPLVLPELTHLQAAEPTTLRIKFVIRINAIMELMQQMDRQFSGKMGGAIGNLTCHYAAYPEIDWHSFSKNYVESFGLHYEEWTDQCVSYANEADIFNKMSNILSQVIKLTEDFVRMASCPAQLFIKKKKKGTKGSSIMPNKSNAWAMEGAVVMLKKAQNSLLFLAKELPNYPHAGNMGRSFLFREIGTDLMPIFIALGRISDEMNKYVPCPEKISAFFDEYPGMSGSSLQTVLKSLRIPGDAYRVIQEIAINPDGSYAKNEEFKAGLEKKMDVLGLDNVVKGKLRQLLDPAYLVKPAHAMALIKSQELRSFFSANEHWVVIKYM